MTYRYKILIAYDGTVYSGWQVQPNGVTIQEKIEDALHTFFRKKIRISGSGRTDAGVHAHGQVAHFDLDEPAPVRLLFSLNGILPPDIRIKELTPVDSSFHARFSAKRKTYHYHVHLDAAHDPFKRRYSTHLRGPFDRAAFEKAARHFIGTHDFRSFTNESAIKKNAIRTIYRLDIIDEPGGLRLEFEGNGFLYKMVRNITGTLFDVAQGKILDSEIPLIFEDKDRRRAGRAAPPQGLFLAHVAYQPSLAKFGEVVHNRP